MEIPSSLFDMRWDGEQWQNHNLYTSTYDSAGYLLESLTQSWDGSQWVNADRWTWSYLPFLSTVVRDAVPRQLALWQNYPNPFNPATTIRYNLPQASMVSLIVYDILGREVNRLVDMYMEPGYHQVQWDSRDASGRQVPSGIYIARLVTTEYSMSIKMVMLK
jgi:hypothetical protein